MKSGTEGSSRPRPVSRIELRVAVCELFCQGFSFNEIADRLNKHYGRGPKDRLLTRETPYQLLREAAASGAFGFRAPLDSLLRERLARRYPMLQDSGYGETPRLVVTTTPLSASVARSTADQVLRLMQEKTRAARAHLPDQPVTLHIGWSGGATPAQAARELGQRIRAESPPDLPDSVHWHALVGALDTTTPLLNPSAFIALLSKLSEGEMYSRQGDGWSTFHTCAVPPLIPVGDPAEVQTLLRQFRELPTIRESYREAERLDIIVTSAGSLDDDHSMLALHVGSHALNPSRTAGEDDAFARTLRKHAYVGDMMWIPFTSDGPKPFESLPDKDRRALRFRPVTLLEAADITRHIRRDGTHVVLAVGSCSVCMKPKDRVLDAILRYSQREPEKTQMVTHVVVDSLTASTLLESPPAGR